MALGCLIEIMRRWRRGTKQTSKWQPHQNHPRASGNVSRHSHPSPSRSHTAPLPTGRDLHTHMQIPAWIYRQIQSLLSNSHTNPQLQARKTVRVAIMVISFTCDISLSEASHNQSPTQSKHKCGAQVSLLGHFQGIPSVTESEQSVPWHGMREIHFKKVCCSFIKFKDTNS